MQYILNKYIQWDKVVGYHSHNQYNKQDTIEVQYNFVQQSNFTQFAVGADTDGHPISRTLLQINNIPNVGYIAWNDQNPNGSTTSVKAHAKSVLIFDKITKEGIVVVHSMPKYPNINNDRVNQTIPDSQKVYGQHFFCFKGSSALMNEIIDKTSTTRLNVYAANVPVPAERTTNTLFQYSNATVGSTNLKAIYKNGRMNGSLFEDGLPNLFGSDIISETWGRPLQLPWCGNEDTPFHVGNVEYMQFEGDIGWKTTKDHSKWAIAQKTGIEYSCFGDMNQMTSQWKRGGSFYCIQSALLKEALKQAILVQQVCSEWYHDQCCLYPLQFTTYIIFSCKAVSNERSRMVSLFFLDVNASFPQQIVSQSILYNVQLGSPLFYFIFIYFFSGSLSSVKVLMAALTGVTLTLCAVGLWCSW